MKVSSNHISHFFKLFFLFDNEILDEKFEKILENAIFDIHGILFVLWLEGCIYSFLGCVSLLVHMKLAIKSKRNNMKVFYLKTRACFSQMLRAKSMQ